MSVEQGVLQFGPEEQTHPEGMSVPRTDEGLKAAPPRTEDERLDPGPIELVLLSGTRFDLESLRLRQFLRLLRIISRGAADVLDQTRINFNDGEDFIQTFFGMVMFSIPDAEEETVDFLKSMVRPVGLTGKPDEDLEKVRALSAELDNPELEDTVTIIQAVIEREGEDLRALGKRLSGMLQVAQKMGATQGDRKSVV